MVSAPASERITPAWQAWLRALATDAEAALGAALAYEALDEQGREAFLNALEQDAPRLGVPPVALFAPFLSVEDDAARRARLQQALGEDFGSAQCRRASALAGLHGGIERVVVFITPVYLDFVRVISCRFTRGKGIGWVRTDPLVSFNDAPRAGAHLDGMELESVPLQTVVDEVAQALVAQRSHDGMLPDSLRPLLDLFEAQLREPDPSW